MQCILSQTLSIPFVQGMSEAETSHEVYRFTCQARSKLEGHLDLRLEGLGRLTGAEVFSHELIIPPGKQSALGHALQLTLVPGCLKQPGDPLRWGRGLSGVCVDTLASWQDRWRCAGMVQWRQGAAVRDLFSVRSILAAVHKTLYAACFTGACLQRHRLLSPAAQSRPHLQPCSHCSRSRSAVPVQPSQA